MNNLNLFHYIYKDNKAEKTLFLLHGTGGDEHNFLFLDEPLESRYNLVGLRGNVSENGMNRFFKRFSPTEYDQENIKEETNKLRRFIIQWRNDNNLSSQNSAFLGYSNGANMLLATLLYYPEIVNKLVLLHAMLPFMPIKPLDLSSHSVFFSYGSNDELITAPESKKAISLLTAYGAQITEHEYHRGHDISREEILDATAFLNTL